MERKDYGHYYFAIIMVIAAVVLYAQADDLSIDRVLAVILVFAAFFYLKYRERKRREYIAGELQTRNGIDELNAE
ncbi:hypothetical protein LCGC14_0196420 [marine sediment metagenome]|uniref:Uncharacterized protein n=1 Tax=marine sediment metagenome TaxID=412755 RepID=A0A0F9UQ83_9ZZZZ